MREVFARRRAATVVLAVALTAAATVGVGLAARARGIDTHGAEIVRFTIVSRLVQRTLPVTAVIPPGATRAPRPLLVFLHGKGADQDSSLYDTMFAALARLGPRAPVVVFPYGGADSYWHDRADGAWGSYVMREVIPQALERLHADPTRIAIGGISMGGFGALDLARLHRRAFCAVGGHSAALWPSAGETAPGAFDDAHDFARHDVIAAARRGDPYRGAAVWIDAGAEDPFLMADAALARALRSHAQQVEFSDPPGTHDGSYWRSRWGAYLRFYATALAACQRP